MRPFKYDVIKLIEGVRDRPCLWDKRLENNYKDRLERKMAWEEIYNILDEHYEEMSPDDKLLTSEIILTKWTNIRDAFTKTLKQKPGRQKKKPYIYHDRLKFLLQCMPHVPVNEQEQDNLGYNEEDITFIKAEEEPILRRQSLIKSEEYETTFDNSDVESEPEPEPVYESAKKRKRKEKTKQDEPNIDFVAVDDQRIMNEDEAFFASLLPTIVKYNEDERLEFRIEVLAVMKKIKDKKKQNLRCGRP